MGLRSNGHLGDGRGGFISELAHSGGRVDAPTALTATVSSDTQINLSWTAPIGGVTGYKIERENPIGGGWSTIVSNTGSPSTTYNNTGLSENTQYNYRVSAISGAFVSSPSSAANATTYLSDAYNYFVVAAISDIDERDAANTWFISTESLRSSSLLLGVYLISPTSFASSLYCAIRLTQATYTVGNAPNWSATDGWDFNGVNQFLMSGLNAQTDVPLNNGGLGAWSLDNTAIGGTFIGCNSGASDRFILNPENASNLTRLGAYDLAGTLSGAAGFSREFYAGYVVASNSRKLYRAQVEIGTSATVAGTRPNLEIYMGASNTNGSAASYSHRRAALMTITKGLSASNHNILESANRAYLTSIGRI